MKKEHFSPVKEEEYRVMLPFLAEGFKADDKLGHIQASAHH
jgi:hypothetical protein